MNRSEASITVPILQLRRVVVLFEHPSDPFAPAGIRAGVADEEVAHHWALSYGSARGHRN